MIAPLVKKLQVKVHNTFLRQKASLPAKTEGQTGIPSTSTQHQSNIFCIEKGMSPSYTGKH